MADDRTNRFQLIANACDDETQRNLRDIINWTSDADYDSTTYGLRHEFMSVSTSAPIFAGEQIERLFVHNTGTVEALLTTPYYVESNYVGSVAFKIPAGKFLALDEITSESTHTVQIGTTSGATTVEYYAMIYEGTPS